MDADRLLPLSDGFRVCQIFFFNDRLSQLRILFSCPATTKLHGGIQSSRSEQEAAQISQAV